MEDAWGAAARGTGHRHGRLWTEAAPAEGSDGRRIRRAAAEGRLDPDGEERGGRRPSSQYCLAWKNVSQVARVAPTGGSGEP